MNSLAVRRHLTRGLEWTRDHAVMLALYATAMFLSALLLFSIQPIFAKMVLPKLGGSPAVWAVSMVFFQAVLLGGYAYAHGLDRLCRRRHAPLVHLGLMALAALLLPFGLPAWANDPPTGDAYLWLIGVLAAGVGVPFFAVSANAPLLQSWFARTGHPQAEDPYFLYGASNLGSLIALLAYPFAVEPVLGLTRQASLWTSGFLCLGMAIALCGLIAARAAADEVRTATAARQSAEGAAALSWPQVARWVWLAAIPSGLLVSFTSYVTTDVAAAPFLWVIPLALFLATFILVFRERPLVPHQLLVRVQPLLAGMAVAGMLSSSKGSWLIGIAGGFAAFAVTTLVCHKELYDARPHRRHLTAFYMWMSFGGVVGGIFAALIAPQLFEAIYEFPLLLLAGLVCRPGLAAALRDRDEALRTLRLAALGVAAVIMAIPLAHALGEAVGPKVAIVVVGVAIAGYLAARLRPLRQPAWVLVSMLAVLLLPSNMRFGFAERSFFGVHRVSVSLDGTTRQLFHGSTLHGAMRIKDAAGNPVDAPPPATYFHPGSPLARAVDLARTAAGRRDGPFVVGLVGIGAGSLACYAAAGDDWSFYEIDPVVVRIARDPKLFTFFERCQPRPRVVMGDARLTVAKEPAEKFDHLILDAFASDTLPVHLITTEALQLYLTKLKPDGILSINVSNRFMDLVEVGSMQMRAIPGLAGVAIRHAATGKGFDAVSTEVILLSRNPDVLAEAARWPGARVIGPATTPERAWTDDYSNVLGAILRKLGAGH